MNRRPQRAIDRGSPLRHAGGAGPGEERMQPDSEHDQGQVERFRALVLPHLDSAYAFARYLSRDPDHAADIVQDAFLRAQRGFDHQLVAEPRVWLLAIVQNCWRDWLTARRRQGAVATEAELESVVVDLWGVASVDPEGQAVARDEAVLLRALIERLPAEFRAVLVLRDLRELRYREIATVLEIPLGTVMSRLARARALLRAAWQRQAEADRMRS